jgi:DNA-binding transcriptional ArsR family regulator
MRKRGSHADLSDQAIHLVAARLRLLGDPARLRILRELLRGECSVLELAERVGLQQPSVSKHLSALRSEGIVARRQQGLHSFYSVADDSVSKLCDIVCEGLAKRLSGHLASLAPVTRAPARRSSSRT